MREILFRGKTEKGEWVEGLLWKKKYDTDKFFISCFPDKDDNEEVFVVDTTTLGQFTGLTFKGVKAFEGDIVKGLFLHGSAILGVVAFQDGAFGLAWKRGKIEEFSPFPCMCNVDYEIVGNIHDNPEILGE